MISFTTSTYKKFVEVSMKAKSNMESLALKLNFGRTGYEKDVQRSFANLEK